MKTVRHLSHALALLLVAGLCFISAPTMEVSASPVVSTFATVTNPTTGVAVDAAGNVYIAQNSSVLKVTPGGTSTFATGVGTPLTLTFDSSGNLYVAGLMSAIYKVTPSGTVSTYATGMSIVYGMAFGPNGNLYVGDLGPSLKVVAPNGTVSTLGIGLGDASGVAVDANNNVYVADTGGGAGSNIYKVAPDGTTTLVATMQYASPYGLAFGPDGNLYVSTYYSGVVAEVGLDGTVTVIAQLNQSGNELAIDSSGNIYVANYPHNTVTLIAGAITPIHTISYASGGGTGTLPTQSSLTQSATFTVSANTLTYPGYDFAGWNDGTHTYQPGDTYTVGTSNVTLTAVWVLHPTIHSLPSAPSSVSASITNGIATVSFAPGNTGNLPTFDEIDMFINGQYFGNVCNVAIFTSCEISNLQPNSKYSFSVTAVNAIGIATSAISNTVSYSSASTTAPKISVSPATTPVSKYFSVRFG